MQPLRGDGALTQKRRRDARVDGPEGIPNLLKFLPIGLKAVDAALVLEGVHQADVADAFEHPLHHQVRTLREAVVLVPQLGRGERHHPEVVGSLDIGPPDNFFDGSEGVHLRRVTKSPVK